MPDIQLRFHQDMLVLSAPIDATLARQGFDMARERQYLNLMEPDAIEEALRLETMAGAQCIVTTTEDITQARLAHLRIGSDARVLAQAALAAANAVRPQHVLVEIGPCGLPLDASSKSSLNENRAQYASAARAFEGSVFDAFFLNGFTSVPDLKCALMGVAQASDKLVFASVTIGGIPRKVVPERAPAGEGMVDLPLGMKAIVEEPVAPYVPAPADRGLDPSQWDEAIDAMVDLGASVIGFETAEPIDRALAYAEAAVARSSRPVLTQLRVSPVSGKTTARNLAPLDDIDEYTPDTVATCAVKLYGAGVQFLRATGEATAAYTGALAATVAGLDVRRR